MSVICVSYISLDGIMADPAGTDGTPHGGWIFRYGREAIGGDRFKVGGVLEGGVLLLGRGTWQAFAELWPHRDDPLSRRINGAAKLVATRTLTDADVAGWEHSTVVAGDLVDAVKGERRDVVVMGSAQVVHQLAAADLIDEYRLMTVPTVLGVGERPFRDGADYAEFEVMETEVSGPFVFSRYRRSER